MIKETIQYLNNILSQTNYFEQQFELCELITRSDGQITPKQYCAKGEWKEVSNFDSYNGVCYWRKNGDAKIELLDPNESLIACDDLNKITIPLKFIACIPREKLKFDDAYSDDRTVESLIAFLQANTQSLATSLQARTIYVTIDSWVTDNSKIINQEYSLITPKDINYKFIYLTIDLNIEITIRQECIIGECDVQPQIPGLCVPCPPCPPVPPSDPDATIYFESAALIDVERDAVVTFIKALKTASLWTSRHYAIYPLPSSSLSNAAINMVNPLTYLISWFLAAESQLTTLGLQGDGANYGDTGFNPLGYDADFRMDFYCQSNILETGGGACMGNAGGGVFLIIYQRYFLNDICYNYASTISTVTYLNNVTSVGFYSLQIKAGVVKAYKDGVLKGTDTIVSLGFPNESIAVMALKNVGGSFGDNSVQKFSYFALGKAFDTDADALAYYNIVKQLQVDMGRAN